MNYGHLNSKMHQCGAVRNIGERGFSKFNSIAQASLADLSRFKIKDYYFSKIKIENTFSKLLYNK
jgi:hypothetical protein